MGILRALQGIQGTIGQPTSQIIEGSLRFDGSNDYLSRTFTLGDRKRWTWSAWVKRHDLGAENQGLFSYYPGSGNGSFIRFSDDSGGDTLRWLSSTNSRSIVSSAQFRDTGAWYHIVIAVDTSNGSTLGAADSYLETDRVKRYINGVRQYENASNTWPAKNEDQDLNQSGNHFLGRVQASSYGNVSMSDVYFIDGRQLEPEEFGFTDPLTGVWRPKKFDIRDENNPNNGSTWSNGVTLGAGSFLEPATKAFDGNLLTSAAPYDTSGGGGSNPSITASFTSFGGIPFKRSVRVYRTNGQANNHTISFNGGTPVNHPWYEWFTVATGPGTLNSIQSVNNNGTNTTGIAAIEVDGYVLIDGATDNSFYLPMDNQDDFEKDKSGNNNNWTKNGFSGTSSIPDIFKDSPSGAAFGGSPTSGITTISSAPSNYPTWNRNDSGVGDNIGDGGLQVSRATASWGSVRTTQSFNSGKYYWELTVTARSGTNYMQMGVYKYNGSAVRNDDPSSTSDAYIYNAANGQKYNGSGVSYGDTWDTNDTVAAAFDRDAGTLTFYKNGVSQGVAYTGLTSGEYAFVVATYGTNTVRANFGQRPFKHTPPEGYLPLNSVTNRPETVIARPDQYVGIVTYSSNGGTAYEVSGLEFSPDLIITKNRDNASGDWNLQDTVCGITSVLTFNANYAASAQTDNLNSVTANGFTVGTGARFNSGSQKICSWFWKAGGPKFGGQGANEFWIDGKNYASAAAAGLDDGTITPVSASVGTKQGFSIVRWNTESLSGTQSLDTGLTEAPEFVITKVLDQADDWLTFHKDLSSTETLIINGNRAKLSNAAYAHTFNSDGTISGLVVGNPNWWISSRKYVFYSWHSVPGLQKFGKYKGNSSNDGPFVELGFRPSVLLIKRYDDTGNWILVDNERNKFNVVDKQLIPNSSGADYTEAAIDFVSNGFKVRLGSSGHVNIYDFVYAAWAEAPASNLFGGQSNAR